MVDIVNKVLKILVFLMIYQSCSIDSRDLPTNNLRKRHGLSDARKLRLQQDTSTKDDNGVDYGDTRDAHLRPDGLEGDIYDEDSLYDRLKAPKFAGSENPRSERQDPFLATDEAQDTIGRLGHNGDDRQDRQPRLVEPGLTAEHSAQHGTNLDANQGQNVFPDQRQLGDQGHGMYPNQGFTGDTRNTMEQSEALRSAGVATTPWNQVANVHQQSPRILYTSRNDDNRIAPAPELSQQQNPMNTNNAPAIPDSQTRTLRPRGPESVNIANSPNGYTNPIENGAFQRNDVHQPGSKPNLNKQENPLSGQEEEMRNMYRQQSDQPGPPKPSSTGDPCLLDPCLNSGICHRDPAPRGFECICAAGYQGRDCETKILPCDISGCSTLGFCVAAKSGGICMCKTHYSVKFCSIKLPLTVVEAVESKIEEEVKELTSGDKKYKILAAAGIFVVLCLSIHFYRVAKRQKKLKDDYKRRVKHDETPPPPPPSFFKISSTLCREFFFCCGTPDDETTKVKVTGSRSRAGKLKQSQSHIGYKLFPDERLPSRSRLSSRANVSSMSRISKTNMNEIPISTSISSRAKLGDYASYSKGHLSKSHLADDVSNSKTRLSNTRLADSQNPSKQHLSNTRLADSQNSSKHHLSKTRLHDQQQDSRSRSHLSEGQLANDISFNANVSGRGKRTRQSKRTIEELRRWGGRKLQSRSKYNKRGQTNQPRRKFKEEVHNERSSSETDSVSTSSGSSSDDTTDQCSNGDHFRIYWGLDSQHGQSGPARRSDIVYPNISPRSWRYFNAQSFTNMRGRGFGQDSRVQRNLHRDREPTSVLSCRDDIRNGRFKRYIDNYGSYINSNNNYMNDDADNDNNNNGNEFSNDLNDDENEDPMALQNHIEHGDIVSVYMDGSHISDYRNVESNDYVSYASFKDDELYKMEGSDRIVNHQIESSDCSPFDDQLSKCLYESQNLIQCLTNPYIDSNQTTNFNEYNATHFSPVKDSEVENDKVGKTNIDDNESLVQKVPVQEDTLQRTETSVITINSSDTDSVSSSTIDIAVQESDTEQTNLLTAGSVESENES